MILPWHDGVVTTLTFAQTKEQGYLLAGKYIADHSDLLIAVWNGNPLRFSVARGVSCPTLIGAEGRPIKSIQ